MFSQLLLTIVIHILSTPCPHPTTSPISYRDVGRERERGGGGSTHPGVGSQG